MTDRPILFTAANARLIIDGSKTQTRRLATSPLQNVRAGDRLYLREPWRSDDLNDLVKPSELFDVPIFYEADHLGQPGKPNESGRLRPSMFLPRRLTRVTLIITNVRTQYLRETSEADARAEGMEPVNYTDKHPYLAAYRDLWNQLHPDDLYNSNPQIIALTFRTVIENIDLIKEQAA